MDSARFGRVLGVGARHAARTLLQAADAAAAPNPSAPATASAGTPNSQRPAAPRPATPAPRPTPEVLRPAAARQATARAGNLAEGSRRFGRAAFAPAARAGRVLWLEFTGTFFGVFALISLIACVRLFQGLATAATPASPHLRQELTVAAILTALFGYFCASSFLQARRRSRQS